MDNEDIFEWPDGTWCFRHERGDFSHMSDDHRVIAFESEDWEEFMIKQI